MANLLVVVMKLLRILFFIVLGVLISTNVTYFNRLPEKSTERAIIAWDVLTLIVMAVLLAVKLEIV